MFSNSTQPQNCDFNFYIYILCFHRLLNNIKNNAFTPTKRSDAQPLVDREKKFERLPVNILRSLKGKRYLRKSKLKVLSRRRFLTSLRLSASIDIPVCSNHLTRL